MKKILHIEDDTDFHDYVGILLGDIADVTFAKTRKEAKQLLMGSVFDLFLLDLVLKDGSGSNIARELKEVYPDTPIALLSAHDVTDVIEEADACFIKSHVKENDFTSTIQSLLN